MKFSSLPRAKLASLPTPLQYLPNLTEKLKGPKIWVKRDDLTGLAFGGNKARKLEYLMGDAVEKKADYIVSGAGFHSNWCTQTAAAAKKLGLKIKLVKSGPAKGYDEDTWDGNHLLHHLIRAEISVVKPENFMPTIEATMEVLKKQGHNPYYMPVGGSIALGAAGYLNAMLELTYQMVQEGTQFDYLVHATGSGGTQAGLVAGTKAYNSGVKIIGAAVGLTEKQVQINKVKEIVLDTMEKFELNFKLNNDDIIVYNEYVGGGYGFITEQKAEAIKLLAETEGIFIDPVYTATAMACLIDLVRKSEFTEKDNVVFLHTGGAVALFPYKEPLKAYINNEKLPWSIPSWSPQSN
ncbi:MAG: D-cysteine desulfhydrase family protein [Candidatus Bathyarchaeota archaeon]|nr:D-cysteine desulfhydrase family protein [Candidatus Bathyarchaeota archaeon]